MRTMTLPWRGCDVPHAILDINRGCNVRCRACYNVRPPVLRTLDDVERELDAMIRLRRLHTVTIGGGEPTLHPRLPEVVAAVRRRGLHAALMSNGMALDEVRTATLAAAGLNLVLLHVDAGQVRSDLPDASPDAVQRLRVEKAMLAARHGLAAGLIVTAYRDKTDDVLSAVRLVLVRPELQFLVFTGHADFASYGAVRGSLAEGLCCDAVAARDQMTADDFRRLFRRHFRAKPFSRLPSHGPACYDAWVCFRAVADTRAAEFLESSLLERAALPLLRARSGRHVFFHVESPRAARAQVMLNAALGGRPVRALRMLLRSRGVLAMKHIVCQQGPTPDAHGRLSVCRDCPDAVLRDEQWLPVCLADRVIA